MKNTFVFMMIALVSGLSHSAHAADDCASDMQELNTMIGHEFHTHWRETTADDGKPMLLRITEQGNKLHIVFEKTRDGLWGSGEVEVCKKGSKYEIVSANMQPGKSAPGMIRGMMNGSQKFNLQINSASSIKVWRFGWSGSFEAGE